SGCTEGSPEPSAGNPRQDATADGSGDPSVHPDASSSDAPAPPTPPDGGSPDDGAASGTDASDDAPDAPPRPFHVLAIGQLKDPNGQPEIHAPFVMAATPWLQALAADNGFTVTFVESPNAITDDVLSGYDLVLQLNYTPFGWNRTAQAAFEKYLTEGKGGWVGLHHAGLYGPEVTPSSEA